jgi:hypothetical protein
MRKTVSIEKPGLGVKHYGRRFAGFAVKNKISRSDCAGTAGLFQVRSTYCFSRKTLLSGLVFADSDFTLLKSG